MSSYTYTIEGFAMRQQPFDFDPDPTPPTAVSRRATPAPPTGPSWLGMFSAHLAALLVAGVLIGLGVRAWLHWSVSDTIRQANELRESRK